MVYYIIYYILYIIYYILYIIYYILYIIYNILYIISYILYIIYYILYISCLGPTGISGPGFSGIPVDRWENGGRTRPAPIPEGKNSSGAASGGAPGAAWPLGTAVFALRDGRRLGPVPFVQRPTGMPENPGPEIPVGPFLA